MLEIVGFWGELTFTAQAVCFFGFALGCSYGLSWLARSLAPVFGLLDHPDHQRKTQERPVPLMGGLAVFGAVLISVMIACSFNEALGLETESSLVRLVPLLLSASLCCLIGLWDDHRPLRARDKIILQSFACVPFVIFSCSVETIYLFGQSIDLGPMSLPLTIAWLVVCMNVVNLLDGLDGLASTIGLIAVIGISILICAIGSVGVLLVSTVLAGSLIGFLLHNWPPAKIYLGDAGSLTIGFFLGSLSLEVSKSASGCMLIPAVVLLSIPAFDTAMAILRRTLNGNGICTADRAHIHHFLQDQGLTKTQSLLTIASLCALTTLGAVAAMILQNDSIAVATSFAVLSFVIHARLFGNLELTMLQQRIQKACRPVQQEYEMLERRVSLARQKHADSSDCSALCKHLVDA